MAQPAKAFDPETFIKDTYARFERTEALFAEGKSPEAIALARQTVVHIESTIGPQHPTGGDMVGIVAGILEKHGAVAEAEPFYLRALAVLEKNFGPEDQRLSETVTRLGWFYLRQDRFAEAEKYFKRSLAAAEREHEPNSSIISLAMQNLMKVYVGQGRTADAEVMYRKIAENRANRFKS
jgi:tetratricopeptide (TPR) repeat protein